MRCLSIILACTAVIALVSCANPTVIDYPQSRTAEAVDDYHGQAVADPYRWLEEIDSAETARWVDAQNAASVRYLEALPDRTEIARRLTRVESATRESRTRRQHGRWITRQANQEGVYTFLIQESLHEPLRKTFPPKGVSLADASRIEDISVSPNGRLIAYLVAADGQHVEELRFFDVERGVALPDRTPGVTWGLPQWTADSRAVLYQQLLRPGHTQPDGIDRDSVIAFHRIGADASTDRILLRANPESIGAGAAVEVPWPGRFAVLSEHYGGENSITVLDLGDSGSPNSDSGLIDLTDGIDARNTLVGVHESTIYLLTTKDAPNGRIVAVSVDSPRQWRTVLPERKYVLERAVLAGDRICAGFVEDVKSRISIFELDGEHLHDVPLPTLGYAFWFSGDASDSSFTFGFDSYTHPLMTYAHNAQIGETVTVHESQTGIQSELYRTEQVFIESTDGTRVPMFITQRTDLSSAVLRPTILYAYGAVGGIEAPIFNTDWFTWIDAGGILAVANVRGGGEYGETWHRAGRGAQKQNTYDDFIAAAEYLIDRRYTSTEQLVALGRSNGGMLIGAVITQRPELFSAAIIEAGVLDALRFPSFTAGPRWAREMGDPTIPAQFQWLYAWSPLHNVQDGKHYPATLISTPRHDQVVHPSQSYKFTARLQAAQGADTQILLRAYDESRHEGPSDITRRIREMADRLSFAARHAGLQVE